MLRLTGLAPDSESGLRQLWRRVGHAALIFASLLIAGTIGYHLVDPTAPLLDALYMTVITLTTVGYGEIIDLSGSPGGRAFTLALLLVGFGTLTYFVSSTTVLVFEGHLNHIFWRRRMQREVARFTGHYIVCGASEAAVHAARELEAVGREAVMICERSERVPELRERLPTVTFLTGDPAADGVLAEVGIDRAGGLIAATDSDKDNLVIVVTARQARADIRIVAQAESHAMAEKLRRVGADSVVMPHVIGGLRIASELVRPTAVSFLDQMLRDREANLRVDEVQLSPAWPLIGATIGSIDFRSLSDALLLACRDADGTWRYNPPVDHVLAPGSTLVLMGTPADLDRLRSALAPALAYNLPG